MWTPKTRNKKEHEFTDIVLGGNGKTIADPVRIANILNLSFAEMEEI